MNRWQLWSLWGVCFLLGILLGHLAVRGGTTTEGQTDAPTMASEAPETPQEASSPPSEGNPVSPPVVEEIRASMDAMPEVPPCEPIDFMPIPETTTAQVWEGHQYATARDAWMNEIIAPKLNWINRVTRYVRCMGMNVSDEDIAYFVQLAIDGGYDPRLWCVMAMAENKVPPNIYGYCGGAGSEWANPNLLGISGWRGETEYLHNRITQFYAQHVDISKPENVLYFHYKGDPPSGNPREVFYVDNVCNWMEGF